MIIRKATANDSEAIAKLLMLVMKFMVYRFIGEENEEKATKFLIHFIREQANQYSYQNCYVAEENGLVVGVIDIYDGADLEVLRRPILDHIRQKFNPELTIEDETQAGEYYIDCISVDPFYQGKGIGAQLLKHVINEFCTIDKQTIGLLVDQKNPKAKRLYLGLGFEKVDEKILCGHEMEHLQFKMTL